MTGEQWEKIKTLFDAALKLPADHRRSYLQGRCDTDPALVSVVLELLSNHDTEQSVLSPPLADARVFACGQLLAGRFRVVRFIARGGMGEVYEAYDERLRTRIALKTMRADLSGDDQALHRFRREVQIARGVSHENLARLFDLFEINESDECVSCISMELLEGTNLASYLDEHRPLAISEAFELIEQMGRGLTALHEHGIVHRDLKPSNVMLTPRPDGTRRVAVTDFGLAKPLTGEADLFESRWGFRAGAPFFMAPELWDDGRPTVRSDIYSFGLIIDEMVTRSRAFVTDSLPGLYFSKLRDGPVPPSKRAPSLPEHWESVILRCLEIRPERRYERVADIVNDLGYGVCRARRLDMRQVGSLLTRRVAISVSIPVLVGGAVVSGLLMRPQSTSVAVFQVENQTARADLDYLCRGTAAELMRRLSLLDGIRVVPVYEPAGKPALKTGTKFSLSGLLQSAGSDLRLTVQLVDNRSGELAWSDNFDNRRMQNPLELQSAIARQAAAALLSKTTGVSSGSTLASLTNTVRGAFPFQTRHLDAPTRDPAAFDEYLRGIRLLEDSTAPGTQAGIQCLENAIERDPNFALAYSALADAQITMMEFNYAPTATLIERGRVLASEAVRRDPDCPEAHASLGVFEQHRWEWGAAETSYRQSLRLKPHFARARRWFAGLVIQFARFDQALDMARQSLDEDPFDYAAYPGVGLYYFFAGQYDASIRILQQAIAARNLLPARHNLANVYAKLGSLSSGATAASYFQKAFEQTARTAEMETPVFGRSRYSDRMYALLHALAHNPRAAQPYLDRLYIDMTAGRMSPVVVAWSQAALGRTDEALSLLESALQLRDRKLLNLRVHPLFEPLRGTDRFRSILAQMRLA